MSLHSQPTVSEKRLSLKLNGNVRYQQKTPYRESLPRERSECFGHGATHVIFAPLDFIARLAALVPKPRVNLTRFHSVFAPDSINLFTPFQWQFPEEQSKAACRFGLTPGKAAQVVQTRANGWIVSAE